MIYKEMITVVLLLIKKRANTLDYKLAKKHIAMTLCDMIDAILILFAGDNPDKVFKT